MATHRLPVYVWNDPLGHVYALPVDADHFYRGEDYDSVVAPSVDQALKQVQEGLRHHLEAVRRRAEDNSCPDPIEYELKTVTVDVRPRYEKEGRQFPLNDRIEFLLPILIGKESTVDADGRRQHMLRCCMPTITQWFSCFESDDYRIIAAETYRETLCDFSPEEILHDVPVPKGKIMYTHVRDKHRTPRKIARRFEHLQRVARPLLSDLKPGTANAYGREAELAKLVALVSQTRRNIALLAPEGTGRSTLLAAAVRQIEKKSNNDDEIATSDQGGYLPVKHRFWSSTPANMISGAKYLGQWQGRISGVIDDLAKFDGVLCLDNLAELARLGGEAEESVAAFLSPYLEAGTLRLIGEITPRELDILQHRCGEFIDKFSHFPLEPLGIGETTAALKQLGNTLCRDRKQANETAVDEDVPHHLVRLVRRFYPYAAMPGEASRFLRRLVVAASRSESKRIDLRNTTDLFLEETGLPASLLKDSETLPFDDVYDYFSRSIIGQDTPCRTAAQAVVNFKAAMNDPGRPIRSMLFCGPTGVGKTQLAKTLADYLFGNSPVTESQRKTNGKHAASSHFFRVDMSEYMHPWSATRLIEQESGAPSALIRHVRLKPFSVVLFDEIEKAASEVFDLLLGLLDEGRLTDRFGRTTSFQSSIVIMTSNLGGGTTSIGFGGDAVQSAKQNDSRFLKAVRDHFRPEFFNRIDDIVPFHALDRDCCRRIIVHELEKLEKREGLAARKLSFVPTELLIERLLTSGFDAKFGARPLQREIESFVLPHLAARLLRPETASESTEYFRLVPQGDR